MSAVNIDVCRQVLRERLLTTVGITASMMRYEGRAGKRPSPPALHIIEELNIIEDKQVANQTAGVLARIVFEVCAPLERGTEAPEDLSRAIARNFEPGTFLQSQGVEVYIDRAERDDSYADEAWWYSPVSILWRSYATTS